MNNIEDNLNRRIRDSVIVLFIATLFIGFAIGTGVSSICYCRQLIDLKTAVQECSDKETFEKIRVRYLELQHVQTDRLFEETK